MLSSIVLGLPGIGMGMSGATGAIGPRGPAGPAGAPGPVGPRGPPGNCTGCGTSNAVAEANRQIMEEHSHDDDSDEDDDDKGGCRSIAVSQSKLTCPIYTAKYTTMPNDIIRQFADI